VQTSSNRLFGRGREVTLLDAVCASGKAELVALPSPTLLKIKVTSDNYEICE
jgi:hypothetical protein